MMKNRKKFKKLILCTLLASIPSTALALNFKHRPSTSRPDPQSESMASQRVNPPVAVFGNDIIIGMTPNDLKEALDNDEDIDALIKARGDELCKFRGFDEAPGIPHYESVFGKVLAKDFSDEKPQGEVFPFEEKVKGDRYFVRTVGGTEQEIPKQKYLERKEKGGRFLKAVRVANDVLPSLIIKNLKCIISPIRPSEFAAPELSTPTFPPTRRHSFAGYASSPVRPHRRTPIVVGTPVRPEPNAELAEILASLNELKREVESLKQERRTMAMASGRTQKPVFSPTVQSSGSPRLRRTHSAPDFSAFRAGRAL